MKNVLLVAPTARDRTAVRAAGVERRYHVHLLGRDLDELETFHPQEFVAEAERVRADGAAGTKDRSALLSAFIAARLGLPGPTPAAILRCQHKPTSREIQRAVVPEAVPEFAVLDGAPPFSAPYFVKPVVGRLSQRAVRVENAAQLPRVDERDAYAESYRQLARLAGETELDFGGYLVEALVAGDEVTLEGYVYGGRVTTIGVTDSVFYPRTKSFERFDYPSRLPPERWDELRGIAERVLPALGFDGGFFNIEFAVPDGGPAKIIEVNARIASQFAPLMERSHGRSTYEALFALACGDDPAWGHATPEGVAISYVVRMFEDAFVENVPEPEEGLELLVRPGLSLSEQGVNDAASYRLAIFYEWGETREEALERCRRRAASLRFELSAAP